MKEALIELFVESRQAEVMVMVLLGYTCAILAQTTVGIVKLVKGEIEEIPSSTSYAGLKFIVELLNMSIISSLVILISFQLFGIKLVNNPIEGKVVTMNTNEDRIKQNIIGYQKRPDVIQYNEYHNIGQAPYYISDVYKSQFIGMTDEEIVDMISKSESMDEIFKFMGATSVEGKVKIYKEIILSR